MSIASGKPAARFITGSWRLTAGRTVGERRQERLRRRHGLDVVKEMAEHMAATTHDAAAGNGPALRAFDATQHAATVPGVIPVWALSPR